MRPSPGVQPAVSCSSRVKLGEGGVLELIHEEVPNPVVEPECEIGGCIGRPERMARGERHLDEVHHALLGEHQPQVRHGEPQQDEERLHDSPLSVGIAGRRQAGNDAQALAERLLIAEPREQLAHARLHGREPLLLGLVLGAGRCGKSLGDGDLFAPGGVVGQQQGGQPVPRSEICERISGECREARAREDR